MRGLNFVLLLGALAVLWSSWTAIGWLTEDWWIQDPEVGKIDKPVEGYSIEGDVGSPSCGSGGAHSCGWTIVVLHGGTTGELAEHVASSTGFDEDSEDVGSLKDFSLAPLEEGRTEVQFSWIHQDPDDARALLVLPLLLLSLAALVATGLLAVLIVLDGVGAVRSVASSE